MLASPKPLDSPSFMDDIQNWTNDANDKYFTPISPIYEPSTPPRYKNETFEPMQFETGKIGETYTRTPLRRKRIYGDEFKELTILKTEPKAKVLKLEQPRHHILSSFDIDQQPVVPAHQYNYMHTSNNTNSNVDLISNPQVDIATQHAQPYLDTCQQVDLSSQLQISDQQKLNLHTYNSHSNVRHGSQTAINSGLLVDGGMTKHQFDSTRVPIPTKTMRNFVIKHLSLDKLPQMCDNCFGIECICNYFYKKTH